jgi:hypothetical protein
MSQLAKTQNLRLFPEKYKMDGHSVDLEIDDLQFRTLRQTDFASKVLLECTVPVAQQPTAQVTTAYPSKVRLKKHYAQVLGPAVLLENIEILEVGDGDAVPDTGIEVKPGSRVVFTATSMPVHGWGKAVGNRESIV